MFFQLIGYSQTGKDSLYKNLNNLKTLNWNVYGMDKLDLPIKNVVRFAFADKLKVSVCKELGIEDFSLEWIDSIKDLPPDQVNLPLQGKTFRTWLKDHADHKKSQFGDSYFVNLLLKDVEQMLTKGFNVYITDTRYPYEIMDNSITIRLFRSDVPIINTHSERSLDTYKCKYVLCKSEEDFKILCDIQPQYENYIYQGSLESCSKL